MRVTIILYHNFLSKEKKKYDLVHNIISTLLVRYPGMQIELLSNDNSFQQNLPPGVSFTRIEIRHILKPLSGRIFISKAREIVNKQKPDLIISGMASRLDINIPEYLLVTDTIRKDINKLKNAEGVIVPSACLKDDLIRLGIDGSRIFIVRLIPGEFFQPSEWEERESIKEELTGGKEYFILNAENNSWEFVVNILKAFSLFKKWQHSNMQLLILNLEENGTSGELLQTYKYRNDVKLIATDTAPVLAKFIKAAMAFIYLPVNDFTGYPMSIALQCEIPAISYDIGAVKETSGDAALYINPENSEDIAGKMIKLYKDEKLRRQLIQKAKEREADLKQENNSIQFLMT